MLQADRNNFAHLDFFCHLLLVITELHGGAFSRGEILGGRNHLSIFKLQILHQELSVQQRIDTSGTKLV